VLVLRCVLASFLFPTFLRLEWVQKSDRAFRMHL
jgi:hypothetical protein